MEAVLEADRLGFDDVWVGEHFSSMTEPVTSPLTFLAKAIPLTRRVRLCTGVLNLPQQHPAVIAGFAAMFDHLADGRFVMGIGPGGLPSDFELFHLEDAMARGRMTLESIDIILKIWAGEPPYRIEGEFWQIRQDEWHWPEFGLGQMPKPYQQPHPPIAVAGMSPYPFFVKEAGRRGWMAISANFIPAASVATHWQRFSEGCAEAGLGARRRALARRAHRPGDRDRCRGAGLSRAARLRGPLLLPLSQLADEEGGLLPDHEGARAVRRRPAHRRLGDRQHRDRRQPGDRGREAARDARADRAVRHHRADRPGLGRQGALETLDGADGERGHAAAAPGNRRRRSPPNRPGQEGRVAETGKGQAAAGRAAAGASGSDHGRRAAARAGADRSHRAGGHRRQPADHLRRARRAREPARASACGRGRQARRPDRDAGPQLRRLARGRAGGRQARRDRRGAELAPRPARARALPAPRRAARAAGRRGPGRGRGGPRDRDPAHASRWARTTSAASRGPRRPSRRRSRSPRTAS